MSFITPKHSGTIENFLYPLLVLQGYKPNQWMPVDDFKNALFSAYVQNNISKEWEFDKSGNKVMKHDSSDYTKDLQLPAYFGFAEADSFQRNSSKRITSLGIKLMNAYKNSGDTFDSDSVKDIFLESMETITFGRNNYGVISSDSDLEAPAIFLKSAIILDGLSTNEFAFILDQLENNHKDYSEIIIDIKRKRIKKIQLQSNISTDIKFLTFFRNIGILVDGTGKNMYYVCSYYIDKHYDRISALQIVKKNQTSLLSNSLSVSNRNSSKNMDILNFEYINYLSALRTKPFLLLAGISGTGKSRIVRKLAQATVTKELQEYDGADFDKDRWNLHRPANFELVQVKPNWHNSMDVVGYLSNIPTPHYVFTPFVEFIVKAWMNPDVPFFLCLDEMNLAPVEEYFAEFLSAIESRAFEDGKYVTDPIIKPFKSFGRDMGDEMIISLNDSLGSSLSEELSNQFKEKGLSLPKNLLVVGTVNMDETTYSFSRKVLDRAMSIEMNDVNYDNFLADSTDEELKSMLSKFKNINDLLVNRHIEAKDVVVSLGKDAETVIGYLKKINTLLEGTPFKLGYRAANEALIYVAAAKDFGFCDVEAALDQFTLMKILSRLEGDSTKMKVQDNDKRLSLLEYSASDVKDKRAESPDKETITLLTCMHKIIEDCLAPSPKTIEENVNLEDFVNPDGDNDKESDEKKKLKSLEKIENMIAQLHRERFVSYWN